MIVQSKSRNIQLIIYEVACVQTAPPLKKKNRKGTVCDFPLVIVFRNNFAYII